MLLSELLQAESDLSLQLVKSRFGANEGWLSPSGLLHILTFGEGDRDRESEVVTTDGDGGGRTGKRRVECAVRSTRAVGTTSIRKCELVCRTTFNLLPFFFLFI